MPGLDQCLSVLAYPGDDAMSLSDKAFDEQMTAHKSRVDQLVEKENDAIKRHAMGLLKRLDTYKHTYSYLTILDAMTPAESYLYPSMTVELRKSMALFMFTFNPRQARYIGHALTRLISVLATGLAMPNTVAIKTITSAIQKIDPTGHMLTSSHLALAKLAYNTNTGALALPVLGSRIVFFPTTNALPLSEPLCSSDVPLATAISKETGLTLSITSGQVMEYEYIVGSIQLCHGNYKEAIDAFARIVSYPSRDGGVSKIMVAAHKRWMLASLVHYGKADATPPHTQASVVRVYNSVNKIYTRIAELFQNASPADLCAEMALAAEQLKANEDWSLAKVVVASHKKWQVSRLRDVFLTISISDVIKTLQVPDEATAAVAGQSSELAEASRTPGTASEAVALIQSMIDAKMIVAEVVEPASGPAYLHFLPEYEWINESVFSGVLRKAKEEMTRVRMLNQVTEEQLSFNRDYIKQTMKDQKTAQEQDSLEEGSNRARYIGSEKEFDEDLMMDGPYGNSY